MYQIIKKFEKNWCFSNLDQNNYSIYQCHIFQDNHTMFKILSWNFTKYYARNDKESNIWTRSGHQTIRQ